MTPDPIKVSAGKKSAYCKPISPAKLEMINRPIRKPLDAMSAMRAIPRAVGIPGILPATEAYEGGIGDMPYPKTP